MPPKTQREREAEQRQVKLERIQEQVEEGSLVIRQMTEAERATFEQKQRERPQPTGGAAKRRSRSTRKSRPLPPVSKG
jgi:hypothetical protein